MHRILIAGGWLWLFCVCAGSQASNGSSTAPSPLNSILPPTGPEDFATSSASPLQRMASITNSLISTPNTPSHHSPAQRPLKAVLPPITQQQFDQFNNLNTEDIVKKVRVLVRNLILGMEKKRDDDARPTALRLCVAFWFALQFFIQNI
jgi:hypothetical protein